MAPSNNDGSAPRQGENASGQQRTSAMLTSRSSMTTANLDLRADKTQGGQASDKHTWKSFACPYHGQGSQMLGMKESQGRGLGPMDRFMAEGASEQYALFRRPDNGKLSISKDCTCKVL